MYKTPPTVEYWEKQNLHGSMILIEGSKTGSAKVTVKPLGPAYEVLIMIYCLYMISELVYKELLSFFFQLTFCL